MVDLCPCCGAVKPLPKLFSGSIRDAILEHIRSRPDCTKEDIVRSVYASDPDGGPRDPSTISVHLCRMRAKLEQLGLEIITSRGPHATYRLVKIGT